MAFNKQDRNLLEANETESVFLSKYPDFGIMARCVYLAYRSDEFELKELTHASNLRNFIDVSEEAT